MSEVSGKWDNADRDEPSRNDAEADRVSDSAVSAAEVAAKVVSQAVELKTFERTHRRIDDGDEDPAGDPDQVTCDTMVIKSGFGADVSEAEIVDDGPSADKPATPARPAIVLRGSVIDAEIVDDGDGDTDLRGASPRAASGDAPTVLRSPTVDGGNATASEAVDAGGAAYKAPPADAKTRPRTRSRVPHSPFAFLEDVGAEGYVNGATPKPEDGWSQAPEQGKADQPAGSDDADSSPVDATPSVDTPIGGIDGTESGEVADTPELDLDANPDADPDANTEADPERDDPAVDDAKSDTQGADVDTDSDTNPDESKSDADPDLDGEPQVDADTPEPDLDANPDANTEADPEPDEPEPEAEKTDEPEEDDKTDQSDDTETEDDGVRIGTMPVHPAAQKGLGIPGRYKNARELVAEQDVLANLWDDLSIRQPVNAAQTIPSPIPGRTADRIRIIDEDGTKVDLIRVNSHAQDPRYYVARDMARRKPQGENIFVPNMPKTAWIHTGPEEMSDTGGMLLDHEVTMLGILRLLRGHHEAGRVRIRLAMETAALMDQMITRMDKRYAAHVRKGYVTPTQPRTAVFDPRKGNARNRHSPDRLRNAVSLHSHRGRQANPQNATRAVRAIRTVQAHREHNRAYNDIQQRLNAINKQLKDEFHKDPVSYILLPNDRVNALREQRAELQKQQFGHSVTGRVAHAAGRRVLDVIGV